MTVSSYLGKDGLTVTSANHLANIAKEMYEAAESKLESIRLYSRDYLLAVNGNSFRVENESEKHELAALSDGLREIGELKSLIAYLREAIKAKTKLANSFNRHLDDLVKSGRTDLKDPKADELYTFDEEFAKLTAEQQAKYFALEAKCATLGAFIHPDGAFSKARKAFFDKTRDPIVISGKGQEAEINTYSSQFTAEEVDAQFFALQKEYRSIQAEFNKLKGEIDERVSETNRAAAERYADALRLAISARKTEERKFDEEVKALKVIIPQNLRGIYEKVNGVASAR